MIVDSVDQLIIKVTFVTVTRYRKFQSAYLTGQAISKFESPMAQTFWRLMCCLMAVLHVLNFEFRSLLFV